jgi:TrmH family RNA methyltransferase
MEIIRSRKNPHIVRFRELSGSGAARRQSGEYVCDGLKLLRDALESGVTPGCVLWGGEPEILLPAGVKQLRADPGLLRYASPLENSPGPLFTVPIPEGEPAARPRRVLVLENVQDPGNVGTVIRTAAALGTDLVILVGGCADPFGPKAARAAMGALFRQRVLELDLGLLGERLRAWNLRLYGAALSAGAQDLRKIDVSRAAVAVGNEGRGLSEAMLSLCEGEIIIPMAPGSESLNAAVAAAVVMWEARRSET